MYVMLMHAYSTSNVLDKVKKVVTVCLFNFLFLVCTCFASHYFIACAMNRVLYIMQLRETLLISSVLPNKMTY